ncbi:hypothetical protein [Helicobacter sp. MIT 14-3879]|uniref:hypothetical protein n=1 Tax=Helicobacter sp. MIT 14-3879 TaxID=2040649 RepID=UPI000E1E7C74|nr:hypothetical protein [Helicobacter sp. MIT 14-3879]RDU61832.1 hypothetical protein CQA44_07850 [Helicobacter sp. MIT 14-3879]
MKKIYSSKKYCYYCNVIRRKYQAKRQLKNKGKKKFDKNNTHKQNELLEYSSLALNKGNINKIIDDTIRLSGNPKSFAISFRKLTRFDLGLCLVFTSLLEHFSEIKKVRFAFRKYLMPKDKNIKNMFIRTGIFRILCNKPIQIQEGKICILKVSISNKETLKQVLLKISKEVVEFSFKKINIANNSNAKNHFNKIFGELLLNVKSHAYTNEINKIVYLAGEVQQNVIKFAILDKGIGFAKSIKNRSNIKDRFSDIINNNNNNYVKVIFESNVKRHRDYSGENIKRGNGTKRLEESIKKCKGAKMQIISKKDFYELYFDDRNMTYRSNNDKVKYHEAIGTLISFELPIKEFLKGV